MSKLSILIECDELYKTGSVIKLDTIERNQVRLENFSKSIKNEDLNEFLALLGLPELGENSSTQHLLIFDDEKKAKQIFDLLIQYSANSYIYKLCYGEMSFEEIKKVLK